MSEPRMPEPASPRTLAIATLASMLIAAIALTFIILPASYGVDPTGLGAAMGFEPDPIALPGDDAIAVTLSVGAQRSFSYPLPLDANQSVHVQWNSTGPLNVTLEILLDDGTAARTNATWGGNATWASTTFTATDAGRYQVTWHNPTNATIEIALRITTAH